MLKIFAFPIYRQGGGLEGLGWIASSVSYRCAVTVRKMQTGDRLSVCLWVKEKEI